MNFKCVSNQEFPESGFSSLDSESETLLLSKSIPRPIPSLVQSFKTRPSPRLRPVLDRETRYFESESLIPLYKRPPKWSDSKLETSKELKFESETCLTMYIIHCITRPSPSPRRVLGRERLAISSPRRETREILFGNSDTILCLGGRGW